ncbi:aquaporin [Periweissella cryptocerci]|uniref:Aquaporin n=1 Tax=Periweissella cryptocerci TaxID=2506420 RepID=A0A4P6YWR3_9LACO|nr:aquaporin [Periweissella cryptocerci]QBO37223.1 aquaporin [Periweissella cryptocerci]
MQKYLAELFGTFVLVFVGTGAVVFAGLGNALTIGLAFGIAVVAGAYSFGAISGGHFNPAVSLAMLINGRLSLPDFIGYVVSQFIGALAGTAVVKLLATGANVKNLNGLGANGFTFGAGTAFAIETVLTFIFVLVIILVTSEKYSAGSATGIVIGLTLALLIVVGLSTTGGSLNPARSFAPAIFDGGKALSQYWVFLLAPLVGGALAALVGRFGFETESYDKY